MLTSTAPDPLVQLLQPAAPVTPIPAVVSGGAPPFAPTLAALLTSVSLPAVGPITGDGTRSPHAAPGKSLPPTGEVLPPATLPADEGSVPLSASGPSSQSDAPLFGSAQPVPVESDPISEPALAWLLPPAPMLSPIESAPSLPLPSASAAGAGNAVPQVTTDLGAGQPHGSVAGTPDGAEQDISADQAVQPTLGPAHVSTPPRADRAPTTLSMNTFAGSAPVATPAAPLAMQSPLSGEALTAPAPATSAVMTQAAPSGAAVAPAMAATAAPLSRPERPVAGKVAVPDLASMGDRKARATAPAQPDSLPVMAQAAVMPPAATLRAAIQPALFALARDIAVPTGADERAASVQAAAPTIQPAVTTAPVAAASGGQQAGIDLTQDPGLHRMIDRIETLRDAANATDTRIRLVPDALGPVEISVRKDGDAVQVRFTAQQEATRQLIADATPRLTELAEARGVRIDRTSVEAGPTHGGGQTWGDSSRQPAWAHQNQPGRPAAAQSEEDAADQRPETRIA